MVPKWHYGQLIAVIVCMLPSHTLFYTKVPTRRSFALIKLCCTSGEDATLQSVTFLEFGTEYIIDLAAIRCVVGRVQVGNAGRWGIIDRSEVYADTSGQEEDENIQDMIDDVANHV